MINALNVKHRYWQKKTSILNFLSAFLVQPCQIANHLSTHSRNHIEICPIEKPFLMITYMNHSNGSGKIAKDSILIVFSVWCVFNKCIPFQFDSILYYYSSNICRRICHQCISSFIKINHQLTINLSSHVSILNVSVFSLDHTDMFTVLTWWMLDIIFNMSGNMLKSQNRFYFIFEFHKHQHWFKNEYVISALCRV